MMHCLIATTSIITQLNLNTNFAKIIEFLKVHFENSESSSFLIRCSRCSTYPRWPSTDKRFGVQTAEVEAESENQ